MLFIGLVGLCFSNILEVMLCGFGLMKFVLWVMVFMVLCNMVLDSLLIYGMGFFL